MIPMTPHNARAIVQEMLVRRRDDVPALEKRIESLEKDFAVDPWEGTAAQIKRLQTRLVHARLEVEALEIVLAE